MPGSMWWIEEMPFWAWIVVPFQIIAVIHALKAGKYFPWVWLIFIFPGIGAAIYFFMEVLPSRRRNTQFHFNWNLLDFVIPGREYQRLKENLELSDTIENRKALAEYYQRHDRWEEALTLLEGNIRGPFKDDPALHLELAETYFQAGRLDQSRECLEKVERFNAKYEPSRRDFFLGRICEENQQKDQALEYYEKILTKYPGEEVRVRLALLLEQRGDSARAREILADVVRRLRGAASHYRREQKQWYDLARQNLKRLNQSQTSDRLL